MTKYPVRVLLCLTLCLTVLLSTGLTGSASAQAQMPAGDQKVYLPLVAAKTAVPDPGTTPTYSGNITYHNAPAVGLPVELLYFDGLTWTTYDTVFTDANGYYQFTSLPTFTWTSKFYVRWINNTANPHYLSFWDCATIDIYNWLRSSLICSFDIADVQLISPLPGQTYGLPQTFTWAKRADQPGDVYALNIADMSDFSPWWYDAHSPGYIDTYIMFTRPPILDVNKWYGWFVTVEGPNGFGASYMYRAMIFTGPHVLRTDNADRLSEGLVQAIQGQSR